MAFLLLEIAAVFYVVTAVAGAIQLVWPRENGDRLVLLCISACVVAHALALGGRTVEISAFPVANLHDGLSLLGFFVALLAVVLAWRSRIPQAAALAAGIAAVLVIVATVAEPLDQVPERLRSGWLPVHVALAFLGDAFFVGAGVVACVYLMQERRLKRKKRRLAKSGTGIHKLPALETLDQASKQLIEFGFPLMTLGLLSGILWGGQAWGRYWTWDPRLVVSLLVWVLYGVLLHLRRRIGWRGRKVAVLTILGVIVSLITYVGLGVLGVGAHGQGYAS